MRHGARLVIDGDGGGARAGEALQAGAAQRMPKRPDDRPQRIGHAGHVGRRDHVDMLVRLRDGEAERRLAVRYAELVRHIFPHCWPTTGRSGNNDADVILRMPGFYTVLPDMYS